MSKLKKFLIVFFSFIPLSAGAVIPWIVAGGVAAITGFSIWRTNTPVDMASAFDFFSSCWTCQMFSAIMAQMSTILPRIYSEIGKVIIPFAAMLTAIYFTWKLASGFLNKKVEPGWTIASNFGTHLIKLAIMSALLLFPLPRLITGVVIEPIFSIGMSMNHIIGDPESFSECVVATTLADKSIDQMSIASNNMPTGAFPTKLRSGLTCELAQIHQITGVGMTTGWTLMNMAFSAEYMHKIMWGIPIFPNIPILFAGLLVLVVYFVALLPIPLYFLEIFVTLSLDLIMLPLMLLGWLFKGWQGIFPSGGKTIQKIIDDVITGAVGIAITCIFLMFGIMFLDAIVGDIGGISRIAASFAENDSTILMDGLMLRDAGLLSIIIMGIFFAMFMTSIPALVKTLFNVTISNKFYDTAKKDFNTVRASLGKWWEKIKK